MRSWYSRLSLRTRVSGIALSITTLSLLVVAISGLLQIHSQIAVEERRSADSVALGFGRAAELEIMVGNKPELDRLTTSFTRDENVMFIAVYDVRKKLLSSAARDVNAWEKFLNGSLDPERCMVSQRDVETSDGPGKESDEFNAEPGEVSTAMTPTAPRKAVVIGHVVVGLSTADALQAQKHQSRLTLAITTLAAVAGAVVLFLTLGEWMRRLQCLVEASTAIRGGDFSGTIDDKRNDEIGRLAQSFDEMRTALRTRDQELRRFTETLQEQVKDRTKDLQKALTVAEEANRAKSLFLANMSHELRTPLNGVIGMVDLMLAAQPNPQQRRYCDIAKSSARSLVELINDILDFSKIEAGKLDLDLIDFDLHEVVEGVAQILGERAQKKQIELLCMVDAAVPRIVGGDPLRMRQVILNLASNAVKFTERGEVLIDARVEAETDQYTDVRISIKDTGIGIPRDRLERLFKSFSQVDASTTRKFGGTGLGLAISQRIVEMMSGRIGVESEDGKGSTFWFTARMLKRSQTTAMRREIFADPRGLRVLAVDDNQTNREIIQSQLKSWSLRADVAGDANEALGMLKNACDSGDPYRFAILDMHMPKTDGMQLATSIKQNPQTRNLILISLSSISDQIKKEHIGEHGFAACLTKPVLPSQLYDTIVTSLAAKETDYVAPSDLSSATDSLSGVRVLLAEDNEVNRLVATELLELLGCVVVIANNGQEAVEAALRDTHDIVLMDCQMPILDGFEATQRIRQAEVAGGNLQHRRIIALTANAIKGDRELCLAAGMDEYLTKPIEPTDLTRTIRAMLSASRLSEINAKKTSEQTTESQPATPELPAVATKPQEADAPSEPPPVDLESLKRRCINNRKLAAKALTLFNTGIDRDLATLTQSVVDGNAKGVASAAHKIKGAAANVSAENVRQTAGKLEQLGREDSLAQTQDALEALVREIAGFRGFLDEAMKQLAVPDATGKPKAGVTY